MSDLVGVVIPAYIGALSSLAGVVVAIVALVTARRARSDARQAAEAGAAVSARERTTRDAVVELAGIAAELAPPPVTAHPVTADARLTHRGRARRGAGARSRSVRRSPRADETPNAVGRRPYWAERSGSPRPTRAPVGIRAETVADAGRSDLGERLREIVRRLDG